eukprot:scaffold3362_cov121-Isochrysis_galbana.AAC.2
MAIETTEQSRQCQTLVTTKQAHSELAWWGSEHAHERGEYLVDLESLADVLGARLANSVVRKTVKVKQGASTNCQPLLTTKRAHFGLTWWERGCALERGECLVHLESLANMLGARVANFVPLKTVKVKPGATTNCQPLLTTKQSHSELGWWGSERALERGECLVDLESLANVLGALVANSVVPKTARAKQGANPIYQPC